MVRRMAGLSGFDMWTLIGMRPEEVGIGSLSTTKNPLFACVGGQQTEGLSEGIVPVMVTAPPSS